MENMEIWNKASRVPPEYLKDFKKGGGFSGTAIKPMWSIRTMTEIFGPVGTGWGMGKPEFTITPAGNEVLVFCVVSVWHTKPENLVYGVGGDKITAQFSSGFKNDDEAFKKASTDALTNAFKMLGVGADIHMGLWDGHKYVDEKNEPEPVMAASNGSSMASKIAPENKAEYDRMINEIRNQTGVASLSAWKNKNDEHIRSLPSDWFESLRVEYSDKRSELNKTASA